MGYFYIVFIFTTVLVHRVGLYCFGLKELSLVLKVAVTLNPCKSLWQGQLTAALKLAGSQGLYSKSALLTRVMSTSSGSVTTKHSCHELLI